MLVRVTRQHSAMEPADTSTPGSPPWSPVTPPGGPAAAAAAAATAAAAPGRDNTPAGDQVQNTAPQSAAGAGSPASTAVSGEPRRPRRPRPAPPLDADRALPTPPARAAAGEATALEPTPTNQQRTAGVCPPSLGNPWFEETPPTSAPQVAAASTVCCSSRSAAAAATEDAAVASTSSSGQVVIGPLPRTRPVIVAMETVTHELTYGELK